MFAIVKGHGLVQSGYVKCYYAIIAAHKDNERIVAGGF